MFVSWEYILHDNLFSIDFNFTTMRPNISNCHALPGTLVMFDGADGSGKTTQIQMLKKLLEKEGKTVTVSEWKSAPIIGEFLTSNEALKKSDERILPETNLFLQAADLLYRIEREVIPALKKNHIVILDRGLQTLIVRGLMIGMTEEQLKTGLLWWRNTIYKELFDKATTVHVNVDLETSLSRLRKRAQVENGNGKEGTLLSLHFINLLVYASDGKKMTRHDKKMFIKKTQEKIIETYNEVFSTSKNKHHIELNGNSKKKELKKELKQTIVDKIM